MGRQLCLTVAIFMGTLCIACTFNVTILVIKSGDNTTTENLPKDYFVGNSAVITVDDVTIFNFWQTEYSSLSSWLVVVDLRPTSCPYQLFQERVLAYVTIHPGTCIHDNTSSVIQVQATPFDYRHLVVDIGRNSGSKSHSVAFLYDASGREYQRELSMTPFHEFLFYLELEVEPAAIADVLASLTVRTDVRYVFLMAKAHSIQQILAEADRLHMLCGRYHWMLFATDGVTPRCQCSNDHSIVLVQDHNNVMTTSNVERVTRLISRIITEMNVVLLNDTDHTCDCVDSCESCTKLFTSILNQRVGPESGIFLRNDHLVDNITFDLYNYAGNGSDNLVEVATWSRGEGIISQRNLFVNGSKSVVLRVAAVVEPPFVFKNESGGYYGYSIDALNAIAEIVGFTFSVKECDDGHYGNLNANGEWTGCINNIIKGDSDIIVGALTVTADREAVVDFTLPYYDFAGIQIVMKKPNTEINLFYFADVFTPLAWLCLGVVIAVTSLLLLLFDRYAPSTARQSSGDVDTTLKTFDLKESIWFVVGSLTMTGAGVPPRSYPARLLVAGFWFFSVIMMSTFTANLAAFLTVSRMGTTINSLSELAAQSDIKYSVVSESSVMTYFQRMAAIEENFYSIWKEMSLGAGTAGAQSNTSLAVWDYPLGDKYVNIWKTLQDTGFLNCTSDAISKVMQGNFAFITDSPIIKHLTYRNCDLMAVGDLFSIRPYAFALKEKSVYTKRISSAILELQKRRMLETLKRKWWDDGKLDCPEISTDQGLDLESLTGSFIVVVVGIASGLLVLAMERTWNWCSRKQSSTKMTSPPSEGAISRNTDITDLGDNTEEQG